MLSDIPHTVNWGKGLSSITVPKSRKFIMQQSKGGANQPMTGLPFWVAGGEEDAEDAALRIAWWTSWLVTGCVLNLWPDFLGLERATGTTAADWTEGRSKSFIRSIKLNLDGSDSSFVNAFFYKSQYNINTHFFFQPHKETDQSNSYIYLCTLC